MCLGGPLQSILQVRWEVVEEKQGKAEKLSQESSEVRLEKTKKLHRELMME